MNNKLGHINIFFRGAFARYFGHIFLGSGMLTFSLPTIPTYSRSIGSFS